MADYIVEVLFQYSHLGEHLLLSIHYKEILPDMQSHRWDLSSLEPYIQPVSLAHWAVFR
jgi:hypothetical protein